MTRIGRAEADVHQDIQLKGLGIANEHCIIEVVERDVFLTPMGTAKLVTPSHPHPHLLTPSHTQSPSKRCDGHGENAAASRIQNPPRQQPPVPSLVSGADSGGERNAHEL